MIKIAARPNDNIKLGWLPGTVCNRAFKWAQCRHCSLTCNNLYCNKTDRINNQRSTNYNLIHSYTIYLTLTGHFGHNEGVGALIFPVNSTIVMLHYNTHQSNTFKLFVVVWSTHPRDWTPYLYDLMKNSCLPILVTSNQPPLLSITP